MNIVIFMFVKQLDRNQKTIKHANYQGQRLQKVLNKQNKNANNPHPHKHIKKRETFRAFFVIAYRVSTA